MVSSPMLGYVPAGGLGEVTALLCLGFLTCEVEIINNNCHKVIRIDRVNIQKTFSGRHQ